MEFHFTFCYKTAKDCAQGDHKQKIIEILSRKSRF